MAIAKYKPVESITRNPTPPVIEAEAYHGIVIDDNQTPLRSLIAYVDGAVWTVNYYQQVIGSSNDIRELDIQQPAVYQQYNKIHNLDLRVEDALASSYDQPTGITKVTGSAIVFNFILPNTYDYFVVKVADGRDALFRITDVQRKTFNRDSVFYLEYDLVGYLSDLNPLYENLELKVIRELYYDRSRFVEGSAPLLTGAIKNSINSLSTNYSDIVTYYFKTFYNSKYTTILVPGQEYAIYDSYLASYLLRIVDSLDAPEIAHMRLLQTDSDRYMQQSQFWEILLNKDPGGLPRCNQQMGLVLTGLFNVNALIQGAAYCNMDYLVYPIDPDTTINTKNQRPLVISDKKIIDPPYVVGDYTDATGVTKLINPVMKDEYYVFSVDFYTTGTNLPILDGLVLDYLNNRSIDLLKLVAICDDYKQWGRVEQYYYGPIILTLIKEALRSSY